MTPKLTLRKCLWRPGKSEYQSTPQKRCLWRADKAGVENGALGCTQASKLKIYMPQRLTLSLLFFWEFSQIALPRQSSLKTTFELSKKTFRTPADRLPPPLLKISQHIPCSFLHRSKLPTKNLLFLGRIKGNAMNCISRRSLGQGFLRIRRRRQRISLVHCKQQLSDVRVVQYQAHVQNSCQTKELAAKMMRSPPAAGTSRAATCESATSRTSTHAWPGAINGGYPWKSPLMMALYHETREYPSEATSETA